MDPVAWHIRPTRVEGSSAQGTPMLSRSVGAVPITVSGERGEPNS